MEKSKLNDSMIAVMIEEDGVMPLDFFVCSMSFMLFAAN